jgi:hypothetical protein
MEMTIRIQSVPHRWRRSQMAEPKESKTNRHFYYSIAKSIVRFVGYGVMVVSGIGMVQLAGLLLGLAEVLGVMEEI